jgi:transcriptional regulator with XRE-family HTH domain
MIQPNLGQKVSELRKAKGLTQEELVELCNISVRTLQRIEHGDVMPRSYTVKSIFSALEYELEDYQDKTPEPRKMKLYGTKKTLIALLGVSLILGATFLFIIRYWSENWDIRLSTSPLL